MLMHTTTWMDLENILAERSRQEGSYIISYLYEMSRIISIVVSDWELEE